MEVDSLTSDSPNTEPFPDIAERLVDVALKKVQKAAQIMIGQTVQG
ncbi:MAG: hypothetical protein K0S06_3259, partial [Microvirga sp.]|nr:hypothetical protein [Microvirga sp.]